MYSFTIGSAKPSSDAMVSICAPSCNRHNTAVSAVENLQASGTGILMIVAVIKGAHAERSVPGCSFPAAGNGGIQALRVRDPSRSYWAMSR
jgi:hypothetical protein